MIFDEGGGEDKEGEPMINDTYVAYFWCEIESHKSK